MTGLTTELVSAAIESAVPDGADTVYVCSSHFHYSQTICGDAGPAFAADYGWKAVSLEAIRDHLPTFLVIDNRLDLEEMTQLRTIINNSKANFILRSADPFWEHRDQLWYRFVDEMLDAPRVHVMLNYQPAEINALFYSRARRSQFVFAPYVYHEENELPIDHSNRQHRLLISGAASKHLYPVRARIRRVSRFWPPMRAISKVLEHPGYPDIGQPLRHDVVGNKYIAELSRFRFAAVCSSRCRLEFLKYREFAYAGVVPVGDLPATLLDAPEGSWIPWRPNFVKLTSQLVHLRDTADRAKSFRQFMRSKRNAREMQTRISEQLARLL